MILDDREPCPRCGELTPTAGRICGFCQASLLVDLCLVSSFDNTRVAYEVAREVQTRWAEEGQRRELPFLGLKRALEDGGFLGADLTRAEAKTLAAILAERHIPADVVAQTVELSGGVAAAAAPPGRPWWWIAGGVVVVAVAAGAFLLGRGRPEEGVAAPTTRPPKTAALSPQEVAEIALPSTVTLRCPGSEGLGFFVAPTLVVTSDHVICSDHEAVNVILNDGRTLTGLAARRSGRLDVAIVRVGQPEGVPLPLGDATTLDKGDTVLIAGRPLGMGFDVTQGLVSRTARNVGGVAHIQVDASVQAGQGGGPLLDGSGRVVGVTVRQDVGPTAIRAGGVGLALPINYLYEGEDAFLTRPPGADRAAWETLLGSLRERRREKKRESESGQRSPDELPILLNAQFVPPREVTATIVQQASSRPMTLSFTFTFRHDDQDVCFAFADVRQWTLARGQSLGVLDQSLTKLLEESDSQLPLYGTTAKLNLETCPKKQNFLGLALILEHGHPDANRVIVGQGVGLTF